MFTHSFIIPEYELSFAGVPDIATHTIVSLETMNKLTLEEFEEKFKVADQRIDDLRKKEKEVSLKLDKLKGRAMSIIFAQFENGFI